jgi:hypothetical protein
MWWNNIKSGGLAQGPFFFSLEAASSLKIIVGAIPKVIDLGDFTIFFNFFLCL